MESTKKTLNYAKHLLGNEGGFFQLLIPLIALIPEITTAASAVLTGILTTAGSLATGLIGQSMAGQRAASTQKHAYERGMTLEYQQIKAANEMEIEKMKELAALNESRLEVAKASGFQRGSYAGPYFQTVTK